MHFVDVGNGLWGGGDNDDSTFNLTSIRLQFDRAATILYLAAALQPKYDKRLWSYDRTVLSKFDIISIIIFFTLGSKDPEG